MVIDIEVAGNGCDVAVCVGLEDMDWIALRGNKKPPLEKVGLAAV